MATKQSFDNNSYFERSLWQQKKREDDDMNYREREEAKEYSKMRMFGRWT